MAPESAPLPPDRPAPDGPIDGRYEVTRLLGQGSFARTLACVDLAEQRRPVAVKELRIEGLKEWKPVELFEREARVLGSLRHPGVPLIHRHFEGRDAQGRPVLTLVMELIDGPSLQDELRAGRSFSELEVVELALALLEVLDYLHGRLPPVFHRDIKPSNVVLRSSGSPVLVDFGGVCQGLRPPQGGSTVTGTFGYMPPEQLLGQVSPASDLYALGATLLHVLTGRPPEAFSYDSGRLSLPAEVLVRPALRRAIDAMLAPAPRDRPASARAARRLLIEAGEARALVVAPASGLAVGGLVSEIPKGGRPETVDMGAPPRDPRGPLRDVYYNLVQIVGDGHMTTRRLGRPLWKTAGAWTGYALLGVLTLGILPGVYLGHRVSRGRRFGPLFRDGLATTGRIVSVRTRGDSAALVYEYEVAGRRYRGQMGCSPYPARYWVNGDPVTVLYDPAEPQRSCAVYRWQEAPPR
jgi:hypothetical protein